jgi:hypothetical protein
LILLEEIDEVGNGDGDRLLFVVVEFGHLSAITKPGNQPLTVGDVRLALRRTNQRLS